MTPSSPASSRAGRAAAGTRARRWASDASPVSDAPALTPEDRSHQRWRRELGRLAPGPRVVEVVKRAGLGVFNDGFIHAGNLAYLSLLTLFPFVITAVAIAS